MNMSNNTPLCPCPCSPNDTPPPMLDKYGLFMWASPQTLFFFFFWFFFPRCGDVGTPSCELTAYDQDAKGKVSAILLRVPERKKKIR